MISGLALRLNPHGGNALNVREALVTAGYDPPPPARERDRAADLDDDEQDDDEPDEPYDLGEDGDAPDGGSHGLRTEGRDGTGEGKGANTNAATDTTAVGGADADGPMPQGSGEVGAKHEKRSRRAQSAAQEEYDCNDGFIDDTDLIEYEPGFEPTSDARHAVKDNSGRGVPPAPRKGHTSSELRRRQTEMETADTGFEAVYKGFYVSRGGIPMRPVAQKLPDLPSADQPGQVLSATDNIQKKLQKLQQQKKREKHLSHNRDSLLSGSKASKHGAKTATGLKPSAPPESVSPRKRSRVEKDSAARENASPSLSLSSALPSRPAESAMLAATENHGAGGLEVQKPNSGAPGTVTKPDAGDKAPRHQNVAIKRRKNSDPPAVPTVLPAQICSLLLNLREVCLGLFGEKKPKVNECVELQKLLHALLCEARRAGLAKLNPERRCMHVQDILWTRLGFLRTTRSNLEVLGHALHWDAEETLAKEDVRRKEEALKSVLDPHRGMSKALTWTPAVQDALYSWWKARCGLLDASNQLGDPARQKSAKKAMQTWIPALIRSCFSSFELGEDEISAQIRSVDDAKTAEARRRKEEERIERNAEKTERRAKRARETELKMIPTVPGRPIKPVPPLIWKLMTSNRKNVTPSGTAQKDAGSSTVPNPPTSPANTSNAQATALWVATNRSNTASESCAVNITGPRPVDPVSRETDAAALADNDANVTGTAGSVTVPGVNAQQSTFKSISKQTHANGRSGKSDLPRGLTGSTKMGPIERGKSSPNESMAGGDAVFEVIELD